MSNTVATFGNAAGETELPTQHWTTYLTLEAAEKPSFFKFMRQVALTERHSKNQPEKSDEEFAREFISNRNMAEIIYSLARNKAENPHDYTKDLPLDRVLGAGIPVDICDPQDKMTALHITSYIDELDGKIAEILLDRGARIDAQNSYNFTPLSIAAVYSRDIGFIEFLVARGANINNKNVWGSTPLSDLTHARSCHRNDDAIAFDAVQLLVSHPDIDWTLRGNTQIPIENLKTRIVTATDKDKELKLRATLSLIQEPLIAHLQQQLAQQKLPEGPASTPTALGDRAPS